MSSNQQLNPIWLAEQLFKNFNAAQQAPATTPAPETATETATETVAETATETATEPAPAPTTETGSFTSCNRFSIQNKFTF